MHTALYANNHANGMSKGHRTRSERYNARVHGMTDEDLREAHLEWMSGELPQNADWEAALLTEMVGRGMFEEEEVEPV